jgi:hypothetical protein
MIIWGCQLKQQLHTTWHVCCPSCLPHLRLAWGDVLVPVAVHLMKRKVRLSAGYPARAARTLLHLACSAAWCLRHWQLSSAMIISYDATIETVCCVHLPLSSDCAVAVVTRGCTWVPTSTQQRNRNAHVCYHLFMQVTLTKRLQLDTRNIATPAAVNTSI